VAKASETDMLVYSDADSPRWTRWKQKWTSNSV